MKIPAKGAALAASVVLAGLLGGCGGDQSPQNADGAVAAGDPGVAATATTPAGTVADTGNDTGEGGNIGGAGEVSGTNDTAGTNTNPADNAATTTP